MKPSASTAMPIPCTAWADKLAAIHRDDLSETERAALREHLATCLVCTAVLTEYRKMDTLITELPPVAPLPGLPERLQELLGIPCNVNQPATQSVQQEITPVSPTPERFPARLSRPRSRLALIAAVLFTALLIGSTLLVFHGAHVRGTATSVVAPEASPPGLYISTPDEISRLDAQTRQVIWHTAIPIKDRDKFFAPTLVLIGNTVYTTSSDGRISAFDAQRGIARWSRSLSTAPLLSPYMVEGLLYVNAFFSQTLYALNPADGTIKATYKPSQGAWNDPIVVDGILYYTLRTNLYAVKVADGKQLWHQQVSQNQFLEALSVHNGIVYVQATVYAPVQKDSSGQVYAFDARMGHKLWQSPLVQGGIRALTVTDKRIYVSSIFDSLLAFDTHTYNLAWHQQINTFSVEETSSVTYVSSYSNPPGNVGIVALRATDGQTIWQKKIQDSQVLGMRRGVLYVIAENNKNSTVYALKASDGSTIWQMQTGGNLLNWQMTVA